MALHQNDAAVRGRIYVCSRHGCQSKGGLQRGGVHIRTLSLRLSSVRSRRLEDNHETDLHSFGHDSDPCLHSENRFVQIHIIYTRTDMLLSKHPYPSWREIQNQYSDYMTSLGPWDEDTIIEYPADQYPDLSPHPKEQVVALIEDTQKTIALTFAR